MKKLYYIFADIILVERVVFDELSIANVYLVRRNGLGANVAHGSNNTYIRSNITY